MTPEDIAHYNQVNDEAALAEIDAYERDREAGLLTSEQTADIAAKVTETLNAKPDPEGEPELSDEMKRIPNRKMLRDEARGYGQVKPQRSRIRRRIYRNRRKHGAA